MEYLAWCPPCLSHGVHTGQDTRHCPVSISPSVISVSQSLFYLPVKMVQMTAALAITVLMAGVVLESVSAYPMKFFKPRPYISRTLTLHAPVSGAQIALSRGIPLQQFVNPGVQSVGDYVYFDDVITGGDPGYPYKQNANSQVVILNKPELDNVNIGGNPGPGFY